MSDRKRGERDSLKDPSNRIISWMARHGSSWMPRRLSSWAQRRRRKEEEREQERELERRERQADWRTISKAYLKSIDLTIEEDIDDGGKNKAAVALGRKGGRARAEKLSKQRRVEIARNAAAKRWSKQK